MRLKQRMSIKIFGRTRTSLTIVAIQKTAYFDPRNKKVIGKFQDEAGGMPIKEFVGLRSKMYSCMKDNGGGGKTAKGIKKNVIKKDIKHDDYKNTLFNCEQIIPR